MWILACLVDKQYDLVLGSYDERDLQEKEKTIYWFCI